MHRYFSTSFSDRTLKTLAVALVIRPHKLVSRALLFYYYSFSVLFQSSKKEKTAAAAGKESAGLWGAGAGTCRMLAGACVRRFGGAQGVVGWSSRAAMRAAAVVGGGGSSGVALAR